MLLQQLYCPESNPCTGPMLDHAVTVLVYYLHRFRNSVMPRGAKKGERRGGRPKGGVNKATIQRAALAEKILAQEKGDPGEPLFRERLKEFGTTFSGLAAAFQPTPLIEGAKLTREDMQRWKTSGDEALFEKYAKLAAKVWSDLTEYQSPKIAPVHVAAPPPERGTVKKRFTIGIFDNQGRKAPRHIDVKPNSSVTAPAKMN